MKSTDATSNGPPVWPKECARACKSPEWTKTVSRCLTQVRGIRSVSAIPNLLGANISGSITARRTKNSASPRL